MSYLLFLDESGHDHKAMPCEVRGIALHASELWSFVQEMQRLEPASFGSALHRFRTELKGSTLLDKDRFKWAVQDAPMTDEVRRKNCRGFLRNGLEKKSPLRTEFTAHGQACLEMATGNFELLRRHRACLFAAAIPRSVIEPNTSEAEEYRTISIAVDRSSAALRFVRNDSPSSRGRPGDSLREIGVSVADSRDERSGPTGDCRQVRPMARPTSVSRGRASRWGRVRFPSHRLRARSVRGPWRRAIKKEATPSRPPESSF